jgi:hypothetical protein
MGSITQPDWTVPGDLVVELAGGVATSKRPELTVSSPELTVSSPELTVSSPELTVSSPELTVRLVPASAIVHTVVSKRECQ